ncbi:MAG TPA: hypothetical protein VN856_21145 [Mycobacterium sp.]|jgi:hypothetical protein|nr:hypothetical protein [Mycobacterium sp.]HXO82385.1 hypothetical protein [Mycobacterium sp.]
MPAPQGATTIVRPFQASLIVEFRPVLLKTGFVSTSTVSPTEAGEVA